MKYKVGDRVRVQSLDWYEKNKNKLGNVPLGQFSFNFCNTHLCGAILTIKKVQQDYYLVEENSAYWTDKMIEGLVEDETELESKAFADGYDQGYDDGQHDMNEWNLPDGFIFKDENGHIINATKIVLEKKTNKEMVENNIKVDMGEVSDGYHTFNELYEYRMLYNAALFNEFAKQGRYDVHKSRKHSDGEYPFGDSNWFIVMAELPTGQISNHYEMKDWDKFQIPEKTLANKWDEHSPRDVANRLTSFTTPKKECPKTYEECCKVLGVEGIWHISSIEWEEYDKLTPYEKKLDYITSRLKQLLICRDAYWKIAGEEMGLGKSWEPRWNDSYQKKWIISFYQDEINLTNGPNVHFVLAFPTEEMRDAFKENFKELIESLKELL